jgi:hypothetical protein
MKRNRPDLGTFTPGALYRHSATGETVEFVGIAYAARAEDTEDIAVFRFVTHTAPPLAAGRAGYDAGETFEPIHVADAATLEVGPVTTRQYLASRFDSDDIFGLRRALAGLPAPLGDRFISRWAQLGAQCEYDVRLVRMDVLREANESEVLEPDLATAWSTVAAAMTSYLAWRSARS